MGNANFHAILKRRTIIAAPGLNTKQKLVNETDDTPSNATCSVLIKYAHVLIFIWPGKGYHAISFFWDSVMVAMVTYCRVNLLVPPHMYFKPLEHFRAKYQVTPRKCVYVKIYLQTLV